MYGMGLYWAIIWCVCEKFQKCQIYTINLSSRCAAIFFLIPSLRQLLCNGYAKDGQKRLNKTLLIETRGLCEFEHAAKKASKTEEEQSVRAKKIPNRFYATKWYLLCFIYIWRKRQCNLRPIIAYSLFYQHNRNSRSHQHSTGEKKCIDETVNFLLYYMNGLECMFFFPSP